VGSNDPAILAERAVEALRKSRKVSPERPDSAAERAAPLFAWAEHGRTDQYRTLSQVRQSCAMILPKAQIKRHLLWRYSIVWKKL
jgi:hypothetical protein